MKKILMLALVTLIGVGAVTTDADAKRFGGGKSFGKQREQATQPARPTSPAGAPAPAGGRSWLGPLAGLAAGGLLASMFMGGAFDGLKMFDILLIVGLAAGVYFLFRRMRQTQASQAMQYAGMPQPVSAPPQSLSGYANPYVAATDTRPTWFEDEPFLHATKDHFIRLQEAYNRGDLQDIREYTTPEVFAEIQLQVQERGAAKNKTDVLQLNAEMVNVVTEGDLVIASVRFSGMVREEEGAAPSALNEVWHIQKSAKDQNASWFVAGIQQVQ
jgi:predicted lipid-binding transport protein (Tim44 family)